MLRDKMHELASHLPFPIDAVDVEFIPTDWLAAYFTSPSEVSTIETMDFLCVHGNVDLDKLGELKVRFATD